MQYLPAERVIACAAAMFSPLRFIHPVRTKRWRMLSLPIALLWTLLAGVAAWQNFEAGPIITLPLTLSSLYLLLVGIVQQIVPEPEKP